MTTDEANALHAQSQEDTMTLEDMKREYAERVAILGRLETERRELAQRIAEASTPFRAGQRVIYRGEEFELSAIRPGYYGTEPNFCGRKIKKDGTVSAHERSLHCGIVPLVPAVEEVGPLALPEPPRA